MLSYVGVFFLYIYIVPTADPLPAKSSWHRNLETATSIRKEAVRRILRRLAVEILRVAGVILILVYIAPSWGFHSSSTITRDFQSIPAKYVVIPLVLLDVAVVTVATISWKHLYIEQKVAYILYCIFLGFPCGTATKIIVCLHVSGTTVPNWALFTPTVLSLGASALAVFLYFTWCGCGWESREQCSTRPDCRCFVTAVLVTALVFVFSVSLVATLHDLWPDTISVMEDSFTSLEKLTINWTGRLVPVWIVLAVVFLLGTGSLLGNLVCGMSCIHVSLQIINS